MLLQELAVVGDGRKPLRLRVLEGIGQGHLAEAVVVAVAFAVRGDMNQFRLARVGAAEAACHAQREAFARVEQPVKRDGSRARTVVEVHRDGAPAAQGYPVGPTGVDRVARLRLPTILGSQQ